MDCELYSAEMAFLGDDAEPRPSGAASCIVQSEAETMIEATFGFLCRCRSEKPRSHKERANGGVLRRSYPR
jgi:hypothetical protein